VLSTAHKRILGAACAALTGLLMAAPAHAAKPPKMKAAFAVDADNDGHVDAVSVRWSKRVRGGSDSEAPFAFEIRGHRVTDVAGARGKTQRLAVAESKNCDTGGAIRLSYGPGRGRTAVAPARGKRNVARHALDMQDQAPAFPRITCAVTRDTDSDGRVDGVRVTYSRDVRSRTQRSGPFLFSVAGYTVKRVGRARARFLNIDVAESGAPDSGARPAVGYKQPARKNQRKFSIRAGRRAKAFPGSFQNTRDGVSPRLVGATTGDSDSDGLLDSMRLRFSEPVRASGSKGLAVLGMTIRPTVRVNGSDITLSLVENKVSGDARPGAWVAGAGVTDQAGNAAVRGSVAPADGAAPVVVAAITQDTGGQPGRIDAVTVAFSEPVAHPRDAGGSIPFLLSERNVTSVEPATGRYIQVRIAEASAADSGERPSVRYVPGVGLPVKDAAGNDAAESFVNAADGVAPVLLTAVTADGDADGRLDAVTARFSEDIQHSDPTFAISGRTVTGLGAASGREIEIEIAEAAASDSGLEPTVSYVRAPGADVRDASNNVTPSSSTEATDGVRPILLSARTADADGDARIDRLETTWSEPLVHTDDTAAPFALSAGSFAVARVHAADGASLIVDLAEPADPDTASRPDLAYGGGSPLRDGAGLEPKTTTWTGLTEDALAPQLVAATTRDGDADGSLDAIDLRFSENVLHEQENAPGSFTVDGFAVASAEAAADDAISLTLTESGTGDTGALPEVGYAPDGGNDIRDADGNVTPDLSIDAADGARPVLLAAATADADDDARIDRLATTWSEPLVHSENATGPFPATAGSFDITRIADAAAATLAIDLEEPAALNTASAPDLTYTGGPHPIRDAAGLEPEAKSWTGVTADALRPRLVSATTRDGDDDGSLDAVDLRFSENVLHDEENAPGSFTVDGLSPATAESAASDAIRLTLTESGTGDTGALPTVAYAPDGDNDVRDAGGNTTTGSSLQAADGARPVLLAAATADADDDARIDRLDTTWSEPLAHAENLAGPFALSAAGFAITRIAEAAGATLAVDLVEPAALDTASAPNLSYTGGTNPIRDSAGLEPKATTWTGRTADALRPRLVTATTRDEDEDGSLDAVALRFSESVLHDQENAPGSFTVDGLSPLSAEEAAGNLVKLTLAESGTGDTGALPVVAYAPDGDNDVRDGAGSLALGATPPAVDGAGPVLMAAATADTDADARLDRLETSWSEPLVHAENTAAPFPAAADGFDITRIADAAGATLSIDLAEPADPDTGSAPDLAYTGGSDPIRDQAALEAVTKTYTGKTRDEIAPALVEAGTADTDSDGRLDAVDIEWSEVVTGSTATAPYTVAGRVLGPEIAFAGARTRVPFAEGTGQFDTDATPAVSYDHVAGDLHDLAEGTDDIAADAPPLVGEIAVDAAAPVLVAAKTGDLDTPGELGTPNGTIDAVLTTFSEPIAHGVDGISPFALNVAGRGETNVEGDSGPGDRTLYVRVAELSSPDGGATPNVSVTGSGAQGDRITDRAPNPNDAHVMSFTGTTDEVRPVLLSAQLGETPAAGGCTKAPEPGIDGEIDCVLTEWSEDVAHPGDAATPYSLSSDGWPMDPVGHGPLGAGVTLELPLQPSASPDRDRSGTSVTYAAGLDAPAVEDVSGNLALTRDVAADAACRDLGREPDDGHGVNTNVLASRSPAFQRKCAFDADWVPMTVTGDGHLEVSTRPVAGIDLELDLFDSTSSNVPDPDQVIGGPGEVDQITLSGLAPGTYWARVSADDDPNPQEGPYCLVYSNDPALPASCGPLAGQIVFTEVGLGADKFIEIKNDAEVPVDMNGASAKIVIGTGGGARECTLAMPSGPGASELEPDERVLIEGSATETSFGCDKMATLGPAAEPLEMFANGAIDTVPFDSNVIATPLASGHSLQFVESTEDEDHQANDSVGTRWCRTFAADSKGTGGDGCDEYRINEVLLRPAAAGAPSDGRSFVELAGNIPALAGSQLLGDWVLRGVDGQSGDGSPDFVLPADASPRPNGTYVVADGVAGATQVDPYDRIWDGLNLNAPDWPDGIGDFAARGLQLLPPDPQASSCAVQADAFGWITTGQGFTEFFDNQRGCGGFETQEYAPIATGSVPSAARRNLDDENDTSYNEAFDGNNNKLDFCAQVPPSPGQLNTGC